MSTVAETWHKVVAAWTTSEQFDEMAPDWVAALGELENVTKARSANVGTYSYNFADLGDVTDHVRDVLTRHDLGVSQPPVVEQGQVAIETTIWHKSGQWIRFAPLCLPATGTPQQIGSAITYARRYSLLGAVGLATEDDDGAAASTPPRPTEHSLLPWGTIEKFREAVVRDGFDADDVVAIVRQATAGRTDDVEAVWNDEAEALTKTYASYRSLAGREPSEGVPQPPPGDAEGEGEQASPSPSASGDEGGAT